MKEDVRDIVTLVAPYIFYARLNCELSLLSYDLIILHWYPTVHIIPTSVADPYHFHTDPNSGKLLVRIVRIRILNTDTYLPKEM